MKKFIIIICLSLLITGCGGRMSKKQALDHTLYQYAKVMRWADYDRALTFLAPDISTAKKPTRLEIERLKQFNISSYVAAPILPGKDENSIIQNVELKLYNIHTKREKITIDKQIWQYIDGEKRWVLTTGLPQIVH